MDNFFDRLNEEYRNHSTNQNKNTNISMDPCMKNGNLYEYNNSPLSATTLNIDSLLRSFISVFTTISILETNRDSFVEIATLSD